MKLIKSEKIRIAIVGCGRISKNHFDSTEVTFDCLNCKEQKRKYKNKKSLVDITTDQPYDDSGVTHPYL